MSVTLPLAKMSIAEKLQTMEALWEDLSRSGKVPFPEWHREVLEEREKKFRLGKEKPISWEAAKKQLPRRRS